MNGVLLPGKEAKPVPVSICAPHTDKNTADLVCCIFAPSEIIVIYRQLSVLHPYSVIKSGINSGPIKT